MDRELKKEIRQAAAQFVADHYEGAGDEDRLIIENAMLTGVAIGISNSIKRMKDDPKNNRRPVPADRADVSVLAGLVARNQ